MSDQVKSSAILERYQPLFEPRTVAVIGASANSTSPGNSFIRNIQKNGFLGEIYPIHTTAKEIEGLQAFQSLAETPKSIDYAFVAVRSEVVANLIGQAAGRVRFAQIMSSGFGEVEGGLELERKLVESARNAGVRLLGPNCIGTHSPRGRITFAANTPAADGCIGILSQSGGLAIDMLRRGRRKGIGFSAVVSLGNCADLGPNDLLEFFLVDPHTKVIGAYIEHIRDGRRFFEQLRAGRATKPIVILKGGRTLQGQRAVASHTGAIADDDRIWRALSAQTGATLVESLDEFLDALTIFQSTAEHRPATPVARGRKIVILGNGGGTGVLAADDCARLGLDVAALRPETQRILDALSMPAGASVANPIDVPANILQRDEGRVVRDIVRAVYAHEDHVGFFMHLNIPVLLGYRHVDLLGPLIQIGLEVQRVREEGALFLLILRSDGDPEVDELKQQYREVATAAGIPVFDEPANAARAFAHLLTLERFRQSRREVKKRLSPRSVI